MVVTCLIKSIIVHECWLVSVKLFQSPLWYANGINILYRKKDIGSYSMNIKLVMHPAELNHQWGLWHEWVFISLHWRHNDHDGVSNHQPHGCLLNRLFRSRSKKTSKLRVTGLCVGNSPGPVNSPHKWHVTRKMFPFNDVIVIPHESMGCYHSCVP